MFEMKKKLSWTSNADADADADPQVNMMGPQVVQGSILRGSFFSNDVEKGRDDQKWRQNMKT